MWASASSARDWSGPASSSPSATDPIASAAPEHEADDIQKFHQAMLDGTGIDPSVVADMVVDAIRADTLWILPHDDLKPMVTARAESIVNGTNPAGLSFG